MKVHPGLLWVEIESAAVEIDSCLEVLAVSLPSDSSFDGHDLAVDAFSHGIRYAVGAVADDVGQTGCDRAGNLLHRSHLRVNDSAIPILKICGRLSVVDPQVTKHLFEPPGHCVARRTSMAKRSNNSVKRLLFSAHGSRAHKFGKFQTPATSRKIYPQWILLRSISAIL